MNKEGIPVIIVMFMVASVLGDQSQNEAYRSVSVDEIQQLFRLCVERPNKCHFIADIEINTPAATSDQILSRLNLQKELMSNRDRRLTENEKQQLDLNRSNAIARALSGTRVQHVEEWYSVRYNRLDETDEGIASPDYMKSHSNMFHDTFINIHDTNLSLYASVSINHERHDADVSRDPQKYFRTPNDLWQAVMLDKPIADPLTAIVLDIKSVDTNALKSINLQEADVFLNQLRPDPVKMQKLSSGLLRTWRISAKDVLIGDVVGVQYRLTGKYPDSELPIPLSSIEVVCLTRKINDRLVCLQASITNFSLHSSYLSFRDHFDKAGFPHLWKTTSLKDGVETHFNVNFKLVDIDPTFSDAEIFAFRFSTNYFVSDMTSEHTIILQQPDPKSKIVESPILVPPSPFSVRRGLVRFILALLITAPLVVLFLSWFRRSYSK